MQTVTKKDESQQEVKQQIKGVMYEEDKMNQVLNLLNTISVVGVMQIKSMGTIFDILSNPVPFKSMEDKPE